MKSFNLTILIFFSLIISTQTFRHIYTKYFEPQTSVLDKYKDKTDEDIYSSKSIDQLDKLYAKAYKKVIRYNKKHSTPKNNYQMRQKEPYKTKHKISEAIKYEERVVNKKLKILIYCSGGIISVLLGLLVYHFLNKWVGLTSILIGLSELSVWTSPLFRSNRHRIGFEDLLNLKLIFSISALLLIGLLWYIYERRNSEE